MDKKFLSRMYPIRLSRNRWKIPLLAEHFCSSACPSKKCKSRYVKTQVKLSIFDTINPISVDGLLCNADRVVVPDSYFKLLIHFPLSNVFEVVVSTPDGMGFTLKNLLYSVKNLYEYIYEEEERTATPQIYELKKLCTDCGNKDLTKHLINVNKQDINLDDCCSICWSEYVIPENDNSGVCKLDCGHGFHCECITKWLEVSGTCPMCRKSVFGCESCKGSGIVYYTFTGVVIPIEERGTLPFRNPTFGIFGIHSYDFEHLLIDNILYDKASKELYIDIIAEI